jgi:predicted  nucleic acid-binding Zn-ribbon protein
MPASEAISFELERFEWARPDRLEVEGRWHGVRRRLARATLVVEVDGKRRRLKALPDVDAGSAERWVAAFPWEGEMPKLPGAELEVGRGIVVDLPRPRRSKARGAATTPAEPIPATSREKREATPGRNEVDRLIAVLTAARTDAEEAGAQAAAAEAEVSALRDRAEAAEAAGSRAASELEAVQARAEAAETELEAMRARAEAAEADLETEGRRANAAEAELETERERASTAEAELEARRGRSQEVESELTALEARAEAAEAEATALRSSGAEADAEPASAPDLERLRTELQTVERERMELRAQLDATLERLQTAERQARAPARRTAPQATAASTSERTETMPGPRTLAAGGPRFGRPADEDADDTEPRRTRRPAERTARRSGATPEASAAASSGPPLGERISDWVASLTGSRAEAQNGGAETEPARRTPRPTGQRTRAAQAGGTAVRTRQRTDRRRRGADDGPSWPLRVAAVGLLALLMVALVVILLSLL